MKIKNALFGFSIISLLAIAPDLYCQQWYPIVGDSITTNGTPKGFIRTIKKEGDSLLIGGSFTHFGQNAINCMAVWDGYTWKSIGNGITESAAIEVFCRYHGQLFAGGMIGNATTTIKNFCKFDNPVWEPVDTAQPSGDVKALIEYGNVLFVGGGFSNIGTNTSQYLSNIAIYNGNIFEYVGWPGRPFDFSIYNGDLYASCMDYGILKWNGGTSWSMPFGRVWGSVESAIVDTFNNFIYIGGSFLSIGDSIWGGNNVEAWEVAMWDGFNWNLYGKELFGDVYNIKLYRGELYAGGFFQVNQVTGDSLNFIAKWNGQHWVSLNGGVDNTVKTMEVFHDTLFVGGFMDTVDHQKCYGLAKWYMPPDTSCKYLQPRAFVLDDTLTLWQGHAEAQFYNNNAYADSWYWDFGDGFYSTEKDPLHDYTSNGVYNVSITVSHSGCTKTATNIVVVDTNTSVGSTEFWNYQFKLYPNPTTGNITVECTLPESVNGEIRTYNTYGLKLKAYQLKSGKNHLIITSDDVPAGVSLCGLFINGKQVIIEKVARSN